MNSKNKSVPKVYNVVLLDRSTSPKVNKYIRSITGKTIWEASTMMSAIPTNILEGVSLKKALDVKSQLGRFGLRAEIKSVTEEKVDPRISGAALVDIPKSVVEETIDESEVTEDMLEEEEGISEKDGGIRPPSRLSHKARRKTPLLVLLLPFILILVVVVIVYLMGSDKVMQVISKKPKTAQYQDVEKLPKKLKYGQTFDDNLAQIPSPAEEDSVIMSLPAEKPGEKIASIPPSGGDTPLMIIPVEGAAPAGSAPAEEMGELHGPAMEGGDDMALGKGLTMADGYGSAAEIIPTPIELESIINDSRRAMRLEQPERTSECLFRLKFTERMMDPSDVYLQARYEAPTVQNLMRELSQAEARFGLKDGVAFVPELTGARVRIHSNLPDSAMVGAELTLPGGGEPMSFNLPALLNAIEIPDIGGLPSGEIVIKIVLLPLNVQPASVLEVIGSGGELLSGKYVQDDGGVVFKGSLNNPAARSRGEVSWEGAKSSFQNIASGQGLANFRVSDSGMNTYGEMSFITISANGVDTGEFIYRSCLSAGYLTRDMDQPPRYLRLIVNGMNYFITTYKCRKLLRDYAVDETAGFDYVINNLIVL